MATAERLLNNAVDVFSGAVTHKRTVCGDRGSNRGIKRNKWGVVSLYSWALPRGRTLWASFSVMGGTGGYTTYKGQLVRPVSADRIPGVGRLYWEALFAHVGRLVGGKRDRRRNTPSPWWPSTGDLTAGRLTSTDAGDSADSTSTDQGQSSRPDTIVLHYGAHHSQHVPAGQWCSSRAYEEYIALWVTSIRRARYLGPLVWRSMTARHVTGLATRRSLSSRDPMAKASGCVGVTPSQMLHSRGMRAARAHGLLVVDAYSITAACGSPHGSNHHHSQDSALT